MSESKEILANPSEQLKDILLRPIKKLQEMIQETAMVDQIQSVTVYCDSMEGKGGTAYQMARD